MKKGFLIFLAHITMKEVEDKSKEKRLEDVPVVRDFPELKELSDKVFIRPSSLTLGSSSSVRQKEGWIVSNVHRLTGVKKTDGYAIWFDERTCRIHGTHEPGVQALLGKVCDRLH
uniref:Uncharacterized protein n=1 Tax=Tanacetum cinerariifolium TaxID=118510 RepID=A0A699RWX1_TANCI|nr:hypothetical protein [Tanacetum cinerariifolium]